MTKSCPVCGSELKPLFSSFQCFNDNCGKPPFVGEAYAAWTRLFGTWLVGLPDDIEVTRCEPVAKADAYDVVYRLRGHDWYAAQYVRANEVRKCAYEAKDVWDYMRKNKPAPTPPATAP